jgi:hypothetical protein
MRKIETEGMHFRRDIQEYTVLVVREELCTGDINTIIKYMRISG